MPGGEIVEFGGSDGGAGLGTWYPMPKKVKERECRICSAPLSDVHDRTAKYCGQEPCPTARGFVLKWQLAPRPA